MANMGGARQLPHPEGAGMQPQGRGGWMGMLQQRGQPPQYGITPPMQGGYQSRPQQGQTPWGGMLHPNPDAPGGGWGGMMGAMQRQPAQPRPMTENSMMLARALMGQRR